MVYREDGPIDWLIDVLEGNRKYVKCLYVYNKIDMLSLKEIDALARKPMSVVVSANKEWNLDGLIERLWAELGMVRVYTKKKGAFPDLSEPLILTPQRGKCTVETAVKMLHRDLLKDVKNTLVWGTSATHCPQTCSLQHVLHDEDVFQIQKKTAKETWSRDDPSNKQREKTGEKLKT